MDKPVNDANDPREEAGSLDLLAVLNRRKAWLFFSCVLGVLVGAAYLFFWPKRYESSAELLVMQNESEPMTAGNQDRDVSEELLATHMKLIQSPRIVMRALRETPTSAMAMAIMDDESTTTDNSQDASDPGQSTELAPVGDELIPGVSPAQAIGGAATIAPGSEGTTTSPAGSEATGTSTSSNTPGPQPADLPVAPVTGEAGGAVPDVKSPNAPATTESATNQSTTTESIATESTATESTATESTALSADGTPAQAMASQAGEPAENPVTAAPGSDDLAGGSLLESDQASVELMKLPSIIAQLDDTTTASDYVIDHLYVTTGGSGRARNARVLNIAFRHSSPEDCEMVIRAVVHHYREFVKTKFKDINSEAAELIRRAKKDIENDINQLEDEYKKFRATAPLLTRSTAGTDIYTTRYEELAAELSQLAVDRDQAAARLDLVKRSLSEFDQTGAHNLQKLSLIDDRNAERLGILVTVERGKAETAAFQSTQPERMAGATAEYSQLLTMKTRLSQLTADFGPEYPEAKALKQQISEMEKFLNEKSKQLFVADEVQLTPDDVMRAYVSMLEHDLQALDRQTADITRQMEEAERSAKELVGVQLEDESLVRERTRQEDLYSAVVERLRDINLKEQQSPLILELIREPTDAEEVEPMPAIAGLIAVLFALVLGATGVLVAELRDRSVHSPEEFEQLLGSRVIAHLPNFHNDAEIRKLGRVAKKQKSPLSPSLLTYFAPDSRASETIRALRTQVMFAIGGDHKIVVTTSASQGAGKSMLSSNMAVSMAGLGANVLLIDCDLRLPQVHRLFGVSNEKGLADAIADPDKASDFIISSRVAGLDLLPSGQAPANPAELLSRLECKELLESLRQKYAYIICDCPPVLAVSDPSILAPLADGVLFVSVVDGESRPKTMRCHKILNGVGARIIGIVVNRSDESTQRYGYQAYGYESTGSADSYYAARSV